MSIPTRNMKKMGSGNALNDFMTWPISKVISYGQLARRRDDSDIEKIEDRRYRLQVKFVQAKIIMASDIQHEWKLIKSCCV